MFRTMLSVLSASALTIVLVGGVASAQQPVAPANAPSKTVEPAVAGQASPAPNGEKKMSEKKPSKSKKSSRKSKKMAAPKDPSATTVQTL
jgi:hypothetical protein